MKLQHRRGGRIAGIATAALALSLTLAACGGDDSDSDADSGTDTETSAATEETTEAMASEPFGEACSALPTDGPGSLEGMVGEPVATAASNNPLLTTLATAVGAVDGLADTLNGADALTVFAPYNDAFAAIPEKDLNALIKGGQKDGQDSTLYTILAHHVVGANADAEAVVGEHETLAGDMITVEGDTESGMTVSDGTVTATVLCGNVPTANATVYVIDQVLTGVQ
ncbi:fasciclin domain-containing protein [Nocardioides sp. GY 10113]|uniref:fasciclin domain-containing protein n=1 Tax=Nocardioides sp. GY 10113 TaxID=2569761 RepID=UPI0010A82568|nr:fasciclin domain-containing protein [Nocardioides sp. GY 10113]TIC89059.1 fasciclin domain-containing protein [Nocardioides sp. GY 10113]